MSKVKLRQKIRIMKPQSTSIMEKLSSGFDDPLNRSIQNECFKSMMNLQVEIKPPSLVSELKSRNNESQVKKPFKSTANLKHIQLTRHEGFKHLIDPMLSTNNKTMVKLPSFNQTTSIHLPSMNQDLMLSRHLRIRKRDVPSLGLSQKDSQRSKNTPTLYLRTHDNLF